MKWPEADENHSHCVRCNTVHRKVCLNEGICEKCFPEEFEQRDKILSEAETRVVTKAAGAATKLLGSLTAKGKSGASMPIVLNSFLSEIGGEQEFGKIISEELNKSRGIGLDPDEFANFERSPRVIQQWIEIVARYMDRVDQTKSLDVSSLEECDIEAILFDLGQKQIREDAALRRSILLTAISEDKKFRKEAFEEIIRQDNSLVDELLQKNGISTVEGRARQVGDDPDVEPFSIEDYDPEAEEID